MRDKIKESLIAHAEGHIKKHSANVEIYLNNSIGIGEHSDIVETIQKELENRGIEILSSGFERIPQITKKLTEAEMADVEKLIEKIEEDDDVMNVYHTMEE